MKTFKTDCGINATVEGSYNSPWSAHPDELMGFSSMSGGGAAVDVPDEMLTGIDMIDLPGFVAKMPDETAAEITNYFHGLNFTEDQIAQVKFYRDGVVSETQWFNIEKPLRGAA
jgi:hypothetical protein